MVAGEPGKRDMFGIENPRVYKGDTLNLKDPTTLTDEIGEIGRKPGARAESEVKYLPHRCKCLHI